MAREAAPKVNVERCAVAGCDQVDGLTWVVDYQDACRAKTVCELGLGHQVGSSLVRSLRMVRARTVALVAVSVLLGVVLTLALRWML